MGAKDVERQSPNVFRMCLMGAEVIPVHSGSATLKDACKRDARLVRCQETAHYMLGNGGRTASLSHHRSRSSATHDWRRDESAQILDKEGRSPDAVIALRSVAAPNAIGCLRILHDTSAGH